jgi:hypothetical protein
VLLGRDVRERGEIDADAVRGHEHFLVRPSSRATSAKYAYGPSYSSASRWLASAPRRSAGFRTATVARGVLGTDLAQPIAAGQPREHRTSLRASREEILAHVVRVDADASRGIDAVRLDETRNRVRVAESAPRS